MPRPSRGASVHRTLAWILPGRGPHARAGSGAVTTAFGLLAGALGGSGLGSSSVEPVVLYLTERVNGRKQRMRWPYAAVRQLRTSALSFDRIATYTNGTLNLTGAGESSRVDLEPRRFFPDQDPIGRRITLPEVIEGDPNSAEIVGVVGDVTYWPPDEAPGPDVYQPALQFSHPYTTVMIRVSPQRWRQSLLSAASGLPARRALQIEQLRAD